MSGKAKGLPFVSIIIPMMNEEKYISQCLQSIVKQKYPKELMEVLVIDGMSEDSSRRIVMEFSKRYPYIVLLDNVKRKTTFALNKGISESKGDIIIRVDAHCYLEPDYIIQCIEALRRSKADNVGGLMRPIGINFIGRAIALAMSSPFGVGGGKFHYKENEMFTDTVYLGAYKREVFDKIGMYDEELHYSEDDELNYRLLKGGGKIFLTPKIRSYYYCRSSIPSFWRQYYNYGYGKVRTLRKHRGLASWRHFVPPAFVLSLICGLAAWVIEPSFRWLFWLILGT